MKAIPLYAVGYAFALWFLLRKVPELARTEAALYRLRRTDRLILEGNRREARRTFAAIERDMARHHGARAQGEAVEA